MIEVVPGSAADEVGIEQGSVIIAIDGNSIARASDLTSTILTYDPGQTVQIEVVTQTGTRTLEVALGERSLTD